MRISRNILIGPKSNKVFVGIWIIVCVQKPFYHFLQSFHPLHLFKIVFRDSSLFETIVLILSAKADPRKR